MKLSVVVSLFLVGFLTVLAMRAAPARACPEGCGAPPVDQAIVPLPIYVPAASGLAIVAFNQQAALAIYPFTGMRDYTQVAGRYCTDKTGGQIFVPADSPVPSGVTCGAAPASPSPSPSSSPSGSPAPTASPTPMRP